MTLTLNQRDKMCIPSYHFIMLTYVPGWFKILPRYSRDTERTFIKYRLIMYETYTLHIEQFFMPNFCYISIFKVNKEIQCTWNTIRIICINIIYDLELLPWPWTDQSKYAHCTSANCVEHLCQVQVSKSFHS